MPENPSRFHSRPKLVAPINPIILSKRWANGLFWTMAAGMSVIIVGAVFWLLAHPLKP